MPRCRAKDVAKQPISVSRWRQSAAERINGGQFDVIVELFAKRSARSPTAGGPAVISEASGEIILKIIGAGQIVAPAVHGHVAVVIVEACNLELPTRTHFPLGGDFFVQTLLQNGVALAPKQSRKRVQFIERGRQGTARLPITGFEWPRPVGHGSKNKRGAPIIRETHVQFRARTEGRSRCTESDQDVFAAVLKYRAISEGQRSPLIKTNSAKHRSDRS